MHDGPLALGCPPTMEVPYYHGPIYDLLGPDIAVAAHVQGVVILEAVVDAEGRVTDVKVLRSIRVLDKAAIEAVKQWRYQPLALNGVPTPFVISVTVSFSLKSNS